MVEPSAEPHLDEANTPARRGPPSRRLSRWLPLSSLGVLVAIALSTGILGVDFGKHWDEWYHVRGLRNGINSLSLIPGEYTYNGVYFDIGFLLLVPEALPYADDIAREVSAKPTRPLEAKKYPAIGKMQKHLHKVLDKKSYILRARVAFLIVSCLALLWVFLAVRRLWPESKVAAPAAAAFLGLSWEVAYHARFIAVDAVMMQFGALTFLGAAYFLRARSDLAAVGWTCVAGAAAGLGFGCKMTGVFLIVPVLAVVLVAGTRLAPAEAPRPVGMRLTLAFLAALCFSLAFFVSTPGALLDPLRFYGAIAFETYNYKVRFTAGSTYGVDGAFDHLWLILRWLLLAVPSSSALASALLSGLAVYGLARVFREQRAFALTLAAFALAYLLFLTQSAQLIVRNCLVLVPILAVGFGVGLEHALRRAAEWRPGLPLAALGLVAAFAGNTAWLYYAASTIRTTTAESILADAREFLVEEDPRTLLLSPKLTERLHPLLEAHYQCEEGASGEVPDEAWVALIWNEHHKYRWRSNHPGFVARTFSSLEKNYDYYANWRARHHDNRIVVLEAENAREIKIDFDAFSRCVPK